LVVEEVKGAKKKWIRAISPHQMTIKKMKVSLRDCEILFPSAANRKKRRGKERVSFCAGIFTIGEERRRFFAAGFCQE